MVNIRLENIEKKFGDFVALKDVNFDIKDGEFFILLGASGSGKSTTLNILSGLDRQTSGKIYFDDKEVTMQSPSQRGVAMVFQDYALYPHMSVYKNMAFPLKMLRKTKSYIDRKVKETASVLEIEKLLDRKPKELSGGQAQRVALGRCLVRDPKLFLLDEPLSNLDTNIRSQIRTELKLIHKDLKKTFVYVTHDQQEALSLGDRIAILHDGNVEQLSPPAEAYNNPSTEYIARFLGEPKINTFELKKDKDIFYSEVLGDISLPYEQAEISMCIRPEKIVIGQNTDVNAITRKASVQSIEDFGSYIVITVDIGKGKIISIRTSDLNSRNLKGEITVSIPIADCYFYNKKDGKRIVN